LVFVYVGMFLQPAAGNMTGNPKAGTGHYSIVFAPQDFSWQGEGAAGLPILSERDGTVCEPVLRFFGWSLRFKRVKLSSMKDEAYILRDWWMYLDRIERRWDDVDDQIMIEWREFLKQRGDLEDDRISRRLDVVFTFYGKVPAAMLSDKVYVSSRGPITSRDGIDHTFRMGPRNRRVRSSRREWACGEQPGRSTVRRPTPDDSAVMAVLTHLRNSAADEATNERDWLIGRVMAEAGLRRDEVARLSTPMLEAGLAKEGIKIPPFEASADARAASWNPRLSGLGALADWELGKKTVLDGLDRLEHRYRTNIYVVITGKGNVKREAPFPIPLVRDILTIGLWGGAAGPAQTLERRYQIVPAAHGDLRVGEDATRAPGGFGGRRDAGRFQGVRDRG
jgi:hypothetical protein